MNAIPTYWKLSIILLLLSASLLLITSPLMVSEGYAEEVTPLPIDGKIPDICWDAYVSANEYLDPSLHVQVFDNNDYCVTRRDSSGREQDYHTRYVYALVQIADPSQIRSAFVGRANNDQTAKGVRIASANHAIIAMNGDYFSHKYHRETYIVRQGKEYKTTYVNKGWDLLIIDQYGDFHVIMEPSRKKLDSWIQKNVTEGELQIVNTFNFGPVLIADGQTTSQNFNKALNCDHIGANKLAQRMCICQMDHLTYMIVTSEGPDNEKGAGLTLNEFVGCLREIEGKLDGYRIKTAFNMDGGNSATLVFKDPDRNQLIKINGQNNQNAERWIKDILYFASAWNQ